jgi:uncharacterized membrane protein YdfJ with MMPL/SSD domain
VVVALAIGAAAGTKELPNGAVGQSARGYSMMNRNELGGPATELAYIRGAGLDPAIRDVSNRFRALTLKPQTRRSRNGQAAIVFVELDHFVPVERIQAAVAQTARAYPRLTVEETGDISASEARDHVTNQDLHRAELFSIPVTLVILLVVFGAVVAALVPVALALTAVAATFGLLGLLSQAFPIDDSVKTVVLLIGMAVGVDYSLFYIVREREERRRGKPPHEALDTTARTSGRTVIVSGTTVAIAMAGMYLAGLPVLNGIATGTIAVVACAVAGSVTVLPAVLELLGPRIDRGRIPFLARDPGESGGRFWGAVVDGVLRHPVRYAAAATALLLALAYPALSLHISKPSDEALTDQSEPALRALAAVRRDFPEAADTAQVVVEVPPASRAAAVGQVKRLQQLALARGITHPPLQLSANPQRTAVEIDMPLSGNGANSASRDAVKLLRRELVPSTVGRVPGVEWAVTGTTAEDIDFTKQIADGLPYVIAFVLVLAFGLLLVAFRSIVVPLKAVVLNLLSVGAAYGVLALVFEHSWAEPLLGFTSNGTIVSWLPLFLFVVLFGLSMDYHVFILSRVREAVDRGATTEEAVRQAISNTAGVVTGAALVMVGVFSLFATLSSLDTKQAGVGLAAAVLIDATIIRGVLLPASMKLLGDWNWYLPRGLEWLPRGELEARR